MSSPDPLLVTPNPPLRLRLQFMPPLPDYRCWYVLPASAGPTTILVLAQKIAAEFLQDSSDKDAVVTLGSEGFDLLPSGNVDELLRDRDLVTVKRTLLTNVPPFVRETYSRPKKVPAAISHPSHPAPSLPVVLGKRKVAASVPALASTSKKAKQQNGAPPSGRVAAVRKGQGLPVKAAASSEVAESSSEEDSPPSATIAAMRKGREPPAKAAASSSEEEESEEEPSSEEDSSSDEEADSDDEDDDSSEEVSSSDADSPPESTATPKKKPTPSAAKASSNAPPPAAKSTPNSETHGQGTPAVIQSQEKAVGTKPVAKPAASAPSPREDTAMPVPTSLGKNKRKQMHALINKPRLHFRFDGEAGGDKAGEGGEEGEISGSEPIPPPRVIHTAIHLNDGFHPSPASRPHGRPHNEPISHSPSKGGGDEDSEDTDIAKGSRGRVPLPAEEKPSAVEIPPKKDYEAMPEIKGQPRVGTVIAYRILEMSADYCPIISDHKEATILSYVPLTRQITLRLAPPPDLPSHSRTDEEDDTPLRKFELPPDDEIVIDGGEFQEVVTLDFEGMVDPRQVEVTLVGAGCSMFVAKERDSGMAKCGGEWRPWSKPQDPMTAEKAERSRCWPLLACACQSLCKGKGNKRGARAFRNASTDGSVEDQDVNRVSFTFGKGKSTEGSISLPTLTPTRWNKQSI
ncbi:hypothetical protein BDK51DRAFT_34253 [Blyttiomyces helicus]|uniref:Coilin tudor domain-containing protein n=1 Tax=Blyttiomyces helicus TaxID=388810 RepID=A0A4P9WTT4_9FUNG|nr:hypothetical protein BDK51DRAFT_34253 [Blyttiomyces helicus]|eukprot:RKO94780.1 hypothetical protein BDK51DRAFT_34253 [Blyttiomyces helicus]